MPVVLEKFSASWMPGRGAGQSWQPCRTWIEVRQQAAEEDLEMPVVLEEFGCKLDARPDQYRLAYDSCLTSAKRGGSCAGVMFWDLTHKVLGNLHSCLCTVSDPFLYEVE